MILARWSPVWELGPSRVTPPPRWLRVARDYPRTASTDAAARPVLQPRPPTVPVQGFPRARRVSDGHDYPWWRWTGRTAAHRRRYRRYPSRWGADEEGPF